MANTKTANQVNEVTIWASGVIQDAEARDTANCIAAAAAKEGKHVQAFDNYVDLPDRVNVPVRKYARISSEEIQEKYLYENEHPNIVVLVEPALIKGFNVLRGMPKGGILIVNTKREPEELLKFLPNKDLLSAVATINATEATEAIVDDFMDIEGASSAVLGRGIGAVLAGAVAKVSGDFKIESLKEVVKNSNAAQKGFDNVKIKKL
jgi:2-oxoacid:acceptor oxidoreductase gamma subunit (pyruvate/2-ketoisovalerate family)